MEIGKYSGETNKRTNEKEKEHWNKKFMTQHYIVEKIQMEKYKISENIGIQRESMVQVYFQNETESLARHLWKF